MPYSLPWLWRASRLSWLCQRGFNLPWPRAAVDSREDTVDFVLIARDLLAVSRLPSAPPRTKRMLPKSLPSGYGKMAYRAEILALRLESNQR